MTTSTTDPQFESIIAARDEPLRCQTDQTAGCENPPMWLAIRHQPCGHKPLCDHHLTQWLLIIGERAQEGYAPTCSVCGQWFTDLDDFARFVRI